MVGKDMTYFTDTVMGLIQQYHPLPGAIAEAVVDPTPFVQ